MMGIKGSGADKVQTAPNYRDATRRKCVGLVNFRGDL